MTETKQESFNPHRWALLTEGLARRPRFQQHEEMRWQEQSRSEQHHFSMRQNHGEISSATPAVTFVSFQIPAEQEEKYYTVETKRELVRLNLHCSFF